MPKITLKTQNSSSWICVLLFSISTPRVRLLLVQQEMKTPHLQHISCNEWEAFTKRKTQVTKSICLVYMFTLHKGCYRNLGCFLWMLFPSVRCLQPAINETSVKKDEYLPVTLIEKIMLIKRVESLLRSPAHTGTLSCQLLYEEIILKEQEPLTASPVHKSKQFFYW